MKKINLSEAYIGNVVRGVINEMFTEVASISYDPHYLDGIDSIDARTINLFIKSMIPLGYKVSKNTPYGPIRQLVLYFSDEGARKHNGRLVKDIVNFMLKDKKLSSIINSITKSDEKIKELIYGQNKLTGKPLMQQIVWNLDEILSQLLELNETIDSGNYKNYFGDSEAMMGSKDGRRIGLSQILYKAFKGVNEIKGQMGKMQALLDKGNDPFSYKTGKFRR